MTNEELKKVVGRNVRKYRLIYTILFIKKKDALIPFGPFLLLGAIVTYILVFYQITII